MNITLKLVLILVGMAYLISPVDLIPDLLLPWVGWIDDSLVLWSIYHLIRYGELPWFLFKRPARPGQQPGRPSPSAGRANPSGTKPPPREKQGAKKHRKPKSTKPKQGGASPWEILGVTPDASWSQIQQAYKQKAKQYHPDKLSHLGEEFSSLANEKFLEIQKAYTLLKRRHQDQ